MHRSALDRLVGGAVSVLLAALAIYVAARLIESVWRTLLIGGLVIAGLAGAALLGRWLLQRHRYW